MLLGLLVFTLSTFAQSIDDAGLKYNEANDLYKAKNYAAAIPAYTEAIKICGEVGADADDLKASMQTPLNNAYYKNGLVLYKGKKFDEAITSLKKANKMAKDLGNEKMAGKTNNYISRVWSSKGDVSRKNVGVLRMVDDFFIWLNAIS